MADYQIIYETVLERRQWRRFSERIAVKKAREALGKPVKAKDGD